MILTGPKLEEFGRALYGDVWVSMLSKQLRCHKRKIMRMRDTQGGLPKDLQRVLLDLIDDQILALSEKRNQLAETFDDG